jgi:hypothetical protein
MLNCINNNEITGKNERTERCNAGARRFKITLVTIPVEVNRKAEIRAPQYGAIKNCIKKWAMSRANPPGCHSTDFTNGQSYKKICHCSIK